MNTFQLHFKFIEYIGIKTFLKYNCDDRMRNAFTVKIIPRFKREYG